ncbi:hypothetical protein, partial [Neptuniibacter sp. 2_MG-2023]|uniref:hypothetical protein n=1 Tax=Neptuniibacter sp. 2_MG-2023 TaxID=3062671 RepID=UPI0026E1B69E
RRWVSIYPFLKGFKKVEYPQEQPYKQRQSDSQHSALFVLLASAQTLTQKVLRAVCGCAGR